MANRFKASYFTDNNNNNNTSKLNTNKAKSSKKANVTATTTPKVPNKTAAKSQSKAEKAQIEMEYSLLEGDINVIPTVDTIGIQAGDNIILSRDNVGCLAGLYLVTGNTITLNAQELAVSLKVQRSGFTDKIFATGAKAKGKKTVL